MCSSDLIDSQQMDSPQRWLMRCVLNERVMKDFPDKPPPNFPETEEAAVAAAACVGCPKDFIIVEWNLAMSRMGYDSHGQPILSWAHSIAKSWAYNKNRTAEAKHENNRSHSPKRGPDRNAGTFNEGAGELYANAARDASAARRRKRI